MIEVTNLTKKYGNNLAIDSVSFTIDKGKIYGFLGPNGAGKSTTMNIMTGYLAASSGTVKINGHDIVEEASAAKKTIGYLPEIPPLYPDMTVKEYLDFVADLKKVPKAQKKNQIDEIMAMVKITGVADRLTGHLSKGYRQNVGIAQAIIGYPEYIILDEPTAGLDPGQIIHVRDIIKKLSKNHTIILSSHILSEISEICDHIIVISRGKVAADDTADNLSAKYNEKNMLELTIKGEPDAVRNRLENMLENVSITASESYEEGASDVVITTNGDEDIREKLFYALSKANMTMLRMDKRQMSLEDIFLEITGSGRRIRR